MLPVEQADDLGRVGGFYYDVVRLEIGVADAEVAEGRVGRDERRSDEEVAV